MPKKRLVKVTVFSLLPLVILLILIETVLAMLGVGKPFERPAMFWSGGMHLMQYDAQTGIRMMPNLNQGSIRLNSLGFRDEELNRSADLKILTLGDSCAFGWGLDDMHLTYSSQLERTLESLLPASGKRPVVEVFNAGTPSYTVYQGLQLYLNYLKPLTRWDVVLISFGWNETPGAELDLEFALRNKPIENDALRALRGGMKHLHLYNALESALYKSKLQSVKDPYLLAQAQYETYYRQLVKSVQQQGAKAVVMAVITRPDDQSPLAQRMRTFNAITKRIAEREGAYWLDLNPSFSGAGSKIGWFDEYHYDRAGHAVVAGTLGQRLAPLLKEGL